MPRRYSPANTRRTSIRRNAPPTGITVLARRPNRATGLLLRCRHPRPAFLGAQAQPRVARGAVREAAAAGTALAHTDIRADAAERACQRRAAAGGNLRHAYN